MMKSIRKGFGLCGAKRDVPSPGLDANCLSRLTLWWLNGHLWRGFRRPLEPTDIYTVQPTERSSRRVLKLERTWNRLTQEKQEKKNSLLKVTVLTNMSLLIVSLLMILLGEICKFIQPFIIAEIVGYIKGDGVKESHAWAYSMGMVLLMVIYSVVSTNGEYLGQVVAMRMRASCTALIAKKAIRLSSKGLTGMSSGTLVNLLATDVEKFYNAASEFRGLFIGPLVLFALLLLMIYELGIVSILPALCFVVMLTTVRILMGNATATLRLKLAHWTDKRILFLTEIVSSMRTIKAYCWEDSFEENARALRRDEIQNAGRVAFLNGLNLNLGHSCDRIVTFLLVVTFVFSGHYVDYKLAVEILTWMKMAQLGFLNFPMGYSMWKQMEASVSRMQDFLLTEEFIGFKKLNKEVNKVHKPHEVEITLKGLSASWQLSDKHQNASQKMIKRSLVASISTITSVARKDKFVATGTFSLRNITLSARMGQLVGLIGPVGSGKTSLLLSVLGNLPIGGGTRKVKGKIAYVPQQHWIRANSIRDNILMGDKINRKWYSTVLGACALQKEISDMKGGDSTKISAKGTSLSRGQCARISLARAVYKDADIYILDDPFSALDTNVATHIFHECIKKLLKNKLVLLTTNNLHFLKYTDTVLVLKEGKTLAYGSFEAVNERVNLGDLLSEPHLNPLDEQEAADVFAKRDKQNLLMPLLGTSHIEREHAHVPTHRATPFNVYVKYWKAGYGAILMTLFCLLLAGQQVFSILAEWWLVYNLSGGSKKKYKSGSKKKDYDGYAKDYNASFLASVTEALTGTNATSMEVGSWTTMGYPMTNMTSHNATLTDTAFSVISGTGFAEANFAAAPLSKTIDQNALLWPYAVFVLISAMLGLLSVIAGTSFIIMASKNLYNSMFLKILWAPLKYLTSDRAGEIVNRMARDTGRMDDIIPITINAAFLTSAIILSHSAYICIVNHYVVIATLPFLVCICLFVAYCIPSIRDTKRLESEFRTPTFDHLQQLIHGLDVIRAFGIENQMIKETDEHLDRHTAAWHLYIGSIYWMKMRLNWIVTVYLAVVLLIALASDDKENMGTPLGLSLAYIIVFMSRIQYFATNSAMLDANMTSVEHVTEYAEIAQEASNNDYKVSPPGWPIKGNIRFSYVSMVYPKSKTRALQEVNFHIEGSEKIGIVGRTGAGKSSIFNVFLRLYYHTGTIMVDGIDIRKVGLQDLRSKITFILQEPMLHSGTLRDNLDPYNHYDDAHIWEALEKVLLKKKVKGLPGQLDVKIEHNGVNFSGGQKQLLCMARALLKMNKIMILDEVTADVDRGTARHINKMLHEEFKDCTILHITHDIGSLMKCDKIMVINQGSVKEFDHPHTLLSDNSSQFHSMVRNLGEERRKRVTAIAKDEYLKKFHLATELDKNHKDEINKALNEEHLFELRKVKKGPMILDDGDENAKDGAMEKSFEEKHRLTAGELRNNAANRYVDDPASHTNANSSAVPEIERGTEAYENEAFESEA